MYQYVFKYHTVHVVVSTLYSYYQHNAVSFDQLICYITNSEHVQKTPQGLHLHTSIMNGQTIAEKLGQHQDSPVGEVSYDLILF